jgi:hypothetical protein
VDYAELLILLIGLVLGALLSIPIGLWVNLKTPAVEQYLLKRKERRDQQKALRSIATARARIQTLERELQEITLYRDEPNKLQIFGFYRLGTILSPLLGTIVSGILTLFFILAALIENDANKLSVVPFIFGTGLTAMFAYFVTDYRIGEYNRTMRAIQNYDEFEAKTMAQISELEKVANRLSNQ